MTVHCNKYSYTTTVHGVFKISDRSYWTLIISISKEKIKIVSTGLYQEPWKSLTFLHLGWLHINHRLLGFFLISLNQCGVQFQFKPFFLIKTVLHILQQFPLNWNKCRIKHTGYNCDTLSKYLSEALNNSGASLSPSWRPISPSCPKYRTSVITLLPADLLSHRAFSTVIPDSSHSCGAKIDLHPYVIGSTKQVPNYYSAPLISKSDCQTWSKMQIFKLNHQLKFNGFKQLQYRAYCFYTHVSVSLCMCHVLLQYYKHNILFPSSFGCDKVYIMRPSWIMSCCRYFLKEPAAGMHAAFILLIFLLLEIINTFLFENITQQSSALIHGKPHPHQVRIDP